MACQLCGGAYSSFLHSPESTGYHQYVERSQPAWLQTVPTFMDMEDAVRAMDHSNLAPHFQKIINRMREALIQAQEDHQ